MKKIRKKTTLNFFLIIILTYLLIIIGNYFLGTKSIINAHQNQFGGGICGASQTYFESLCSATSGFDFYYLYLSLLLFTFIVGFINVIFDKKLSSSLLIVFVSTLGYLVITEIIIKIFSIPVLFTSPLEGRQSFSLSAFYGVNTQSILLLLIFSIISSIISSLAGNIIGFPFLLLIKKTFKN